MNLYFTEPLAKGFLALRRQVLVAEEDHASLRDQ